MPMRLPLSLGVLLLAAVGASSAPAQAPPDTGPLPGLPPLSPQQPPPGLPPVTNLAPGTGAGAVNPVPALHGLRDGGGSPVGPAQPDRGSGLAATWTDGLRFRSADDAFHIHVGGNAQIDSTWLIAPNSAFDLPNNGGTSGIGGASATFLRRVRIRLDGDIYDQFDYMIEYDLANASNDTGSNQPPSFGSITGSPAPTNIWIQIRDVPFFGNVRFGNQVKPIGFSNQVYQGFLPFMERADNWDAFQGTDDNGFSIGLTSRNHSDDERVTWQYGIYRPLVNVFGVALNKMTWGGRVTWLPCSRTRAVRSSTSGWAPSTANCRRTS
ncbi:MAG TPA: porin [Gemmataceae bacterium]|nr:porin [Gemmataceae bacterium]